MDNVVVRGLTDEQLQERLNRALDEADDSLRGVARTLGVSPSALSEARQPATSPARLRKLRMRALGHLEGLDLEAVTIIRINGRSND